MPIHSRLQLHTSNNNDVFVNGDLRLLNLQKRFVNSRSKFKDGHIVLSNTNPPLEINVAMIIEKDIFDLMQIRPK